jgi:hypothetical protein
LSSSNSFSSSSFVIINVLSSTVDLGGGGEIFCSTILDEICSIVFVDVRGGAVIGTKGCFRTIDGGCRDRDVLVLGCNAEGGTIDCGVKRGRTGERDGPVIVVGEPFFD